ncbi:MAG: succinate dehydrogenase/fumarate reductase iron-sulfur subunit [Candidatus Aminicenantia bacterium]
MKKTEIESKTITFKILRYNPQDGNPSINEYKIEIKKGMTVLDALILIKENLDATLSFRYSCRMGVCGSCGMFINGLPALACQTQVLHLESDVVEVKPLPNYDIIRDVVPDLEPLFCKHKEIKPFIIRKDEEELEKPKNEYVMTPEELERISQFTYCIKCGSCLSACPTYATDNEFCGPQALAQAYRYMADVRDEGFNERLSAVDSPHGCWRCHYASACSQACPKGVDPALGIQLLKREITLNWLGVKKKKEGAKLYTPPKEKKVREGIPSPPERTVK